MNNIENYKEFMEETQLEKHYFAIAVFDCKRQDFYYGAHYPETKEQCKIMLKHLKIMALEKYIKTKFEGTD